MDEDQEDEVNVAEEKEEEEEEEYEEGETNVEEQPLTEDEEAIVAYLRDDEPLPLELLQKLLNDWWHHEPFRYPVSAYFAVIDNLYTVNQKRTLHYIRVIYSGLSTGLLNHYCTRCTELETDNC